MQTQTLGYYYNGSTEIPPGVSRRAFLKLTTGATAILTVGAWTCDKASEIARQAGLLLSTVRSAIPLVRSFAPAIATKLELALPVAEKLRAAIQANDQTNAIAYVRQFIPVFTDIIDNDVPQLSEALQQKVLIALALADVALTFIANFYDQQAPASMKVAAKSPDVISGFARRQHFGYKYVK